MAYLAHMNIISVFFIVPIPSENYQVTVKVVTVSRGDTIGSLGAEKQYFVVQSYKSYKSMSAQYALKIQNNTKLKE